MGVDVAAVGGSVSLSEVRATHAASCCSLSLCCTSFCFMTSTVLVLSSHVFSRFREALPSNRQERHRGCDTGRTSYNAQLVAVQTVTC